MSNKGDFHDLLLTTKDAAGELKCSESFLAKARMKGTGPAYVLLGRAVRYRRSDLEAYKAARTRTSTSDHVNKPNLRQPTRKEARQHKEDPNEG
jgi:predicted DNA-binding transcriptional regulator AlpA